MEFKIYYCDLCGPDDKITKAKHAYRADDNLLYDICNKHLKVVQRVIDPKLIDENSRNQTPPAWDI